MMLQCPDLPPLEKAKARDEAPAAMGVSPRLVQAARKVRDKGSERLQEAVRSGKVTYASNPDDQDCQDYLDCPSSLPPGDADLDPGEVPANLWMTVMP